MKRSNDGLFVPSLITSQYYMGIVNDGVVLGILAISIGSVFFGANTYIGNGPNFMVKAIAEQHHVRMPSFFGYTLWSLTILVPLFGIVALLFF